LETVATESESTTEGRERKAVSDAADRILRQLTDDRALLEHTYIISKLPGDAVACARCVKVLERKNTELALEVNRLDYRLHRMRQAFHRIGIRYDGARRGMRHWFDRYKGVCSDYERLACRLDRMRRAFKRVAWVGVMLSWAFADRRFVTALRRVARQQVGGQP